MPAVSVRLPKRADAGSEAAQGTVARHVAVGALALYRANSSARTGHASFILRPDAMRPEQLELMVARSFAVRSGLPATRLTAAYGFARTERNWFAVTPESLIGGALMGAAIGVAVGAAIVRLLA